VEIRAKLIGGKATSVQRLPVGSATSLDVNIRLKRFRRTEKRSSLPLVTARSFSGPPAPTAAPTSARSLNTRKSIDDRPSRANAQRLPTLHRIMREAIRLRQSEERQHLRDARNECRDAVWADRPTGLAAFPGRVTGIPHFQEKLHRYRDRQETRAYLEYRRQFHERHRTTQKEFQLRLSI